MKRLVALTMVAVFIALGAGIALSKAVRVELEPWSTGIAMVPDASGHAILNYVKGKDRTEVQVNCWDLIPDTNYTVYLENGGFYEIGDFTTLKNGSGNFHIRLDGDHSGSLRVAVNDTALNATMLLGP